MLSGQYPQSSTSPFLSKILPIVAILFTTLISILLIWQRDVRAVGTFRDAVLSNPGTTGFVRQIIAGFLGFLWIYVAGAVFNLTTRLRLASPERTPTLRSLNVWVACGIQRVDLSLPILYIGLTAAFVLAGQAIGSVWAGAITPVLSPKSLNGTDNITSPVFHSPWFTSQFADQGDAEGVDDTVCQTSNKLAGFIPACPVPGLQNLILDSARSATTYNGLPRNHSKNDNPSWSYIGRSYGVGSSVGVALRPDSYDDLLSYSYYETGYDVESSCIYNTTSAFDLTLVYENFQPANGSNVELNIYVASGFLPSSYLDSDLVTFPLVQSNQTSEGLLTWAATSKNNLNYASIVAQGSYSSFNNIQCLFDFVLTNFSVTVNVTSSTIKVLPLNAIPSESLNEFDSNDYLVGNVMASLGLLAQTAASTSFESLGENLYDNWQTFNQSIGFQSNLAGSNATQETYNTSAVSNGNDTAIFSAVQDSFNAMLDDILGGFGAAQLYWEGTTDSESETTTILPLNSQYLSIRLGQDGYIFATLAINLVILIIAIEEAIRTRNWKGLPLLDYLNLTSMVVASSAGGNGVAEACTQKHKHGEIWKGKSGSKEAGEVRVRLMQSKEDEIPRIKLADIHSVSDFEKESTNSESDALVES
ncbi:hypothetical protein BDR22DRAFT_196650 [Usnea florida]